MRAAPVAVRRPPGHALLEVRDLHTYFETDRGLIRAVEGVDLSLGQGEVLALVGESGCGKSVTSLSIMRLIPHPPGRIVAGEILLEGTDLLALDEAAMDAIRGERIAMIFQEPMTALNPIFRVGAQVAESLRLHRSQSRRRARDRAVELLQRVGIPDPERRAQSYPHELSGGMRQRVMVAIALACEPRLIIADEPTTALDVTIQAQILELLDNVRRETGTAILLITHDLGVVAEVAERVAVMYAGRIVEEGPVGAIFSTPCHPYSEGLLRSVPDIEGHLPPDRTLPAIPGLVPSPLDLPEGCRFRNRCPYAFEKCGAEPPLIRVGERHSARCWRNE